MKKYINNRYGHSSLFKTIRLFLLMFSFLVGLEQISHAQTTVTLTSSKVTGNYQGQTTRNYGTGAVNFVANESGFVGRMFVEFDLSSIPAGATVTSAQLRLVHANATDCAGDTEGGSSFTVGVRRVTRAWVEGSVCNATQAGSLTWTSAGAANWTTAGGDFNTTDYATFTGGAPDANGLAYTANILTLVNEWRSGTLNYGLALVPQGSGANYFQIHSDDAAVAGNQPQLTITYTLLPVATAVVTPPTTCGGAQGSIVQTVTGGTAPYTYAWSGSAVTTKDRTGLTAGNYTVTITDAVLASSTYTYTVESGCRIELNSAKATSFAEAYSSTWNWGSCDNMYLETDNGYRQRSLVQFNLSSLPVGATITSATLRLVHKDVIPADEGGVSFSTAVHRVTQAWVEGTVCDASQAGSASWISAGASNWTTAGGTYAPTSYGSFTGGAADLEGTVYTTNVTTLVNEWYTGTNANNGLILVPPSNAIENWYALHSDDATDATKIPKLIITYTLQPIATAVVTPPTTCGGAQGSIVQTVTGGTAPYTYAWSGSAVTTKDRTGLTAGNYTVTITDAVLASSTYTYTVESGCRIELNSAKATLLIESNSSGNYGTCDAIALETDDGYKIRSLVQFNLSSLPVGATITSATLRLVHKDIIPTDEGGVSFSTAVHRVTQPWVEGTVCDAAQTGSATWTSAGASNWTTPGGTYAPTSYGSFTGGAADLEGTVYTTNVTTLVNEWYTGTNANNGLILVPPSNAIENWYALHSDDATDATKIPKLIITYTLPPPVATAVITPTNCGGTGGSIVQTVSSGTAPYTYAWADGPTTKDRTGLLKGTYTVTITDAASSTAVISYVVTQPLCVNSSTSNVSCFGGSNGFINITATGGTAPYTYNWGGGITTKNRTGLAAGTYNLTITDNVAATATASITITQPTALAAAGVITQPTCSVAGSINLTASGGTSPYRYDWADVAGTNNPEDRSGLVAGAYAVTVTDSKGCTATASFTLTAPTCAPAFITVCKSDAADVFSVTPDPTITTYTWTVTGGGTIVSGQGTPSVTVNWTAATVGTGTVCCKTLNSCGESANTCQNVYIRGPVAGATVSTPVCVGSSILLSGSGGVSYLWSGPSGFTANSEAPVINNATLARTGTYFVTVTDASGCSATASVPVTVFTPPTATSVVTNSTCGTANGSIALTPASGTTPYTYLWSNGITTQNLSDQLASSYTVTVTDNNGCKVQHTANIGNNTAQTVALTPTNVSCFGGSNGQITTSLSGGSAPFTYLWSNGATTQNLSSVATGSYQVIVTGADGCIGVASASLSQPNELAINTAITAINCIGGSTGAINIRVTGGATPYTFNWNDGITTEDRTGLSAGVYTVTVTDNNSCSRITTAVVTQPGSPLTATTVPTHVTCNGAANGVVNLTASGGTSPYTYLWTGGATTEDISNKAPGLYSVTVTDAKGCTITSGTTITQPAALSLTNAVTSVNCNGGTTGAINLTPTGGTAPLSILWSNGATTEDLSAISAGTYGVTVTDAKACTATASISVTQPTTLTATATPTNVVCNGGTTGGISMAIAGGTTAYTYLWSSGQTTQNLTSIGAGTYTLTVTDARGCQAVAQSTLTQPTAISLVGTVTNVACNGGSTGAINLTVTNSVGAVTYNWGGGITSQNRTAIAAGTYTVTVTDANLCTATSSFIVTQPAAPLAATSTKTDATCAGNADGSVNLSVTGGSLPYTYSWSNGATTEDVSTLTAGTYTVTVTDARSCTTTRSVTITQPAAFVLSATATSAACGGGTNGTIDLTVSGGVSPYTFSWSNGTTTEDISGITAGNYTVTVTGANGCTAERSNIAVSETNTMTITSTVTNNLCPGSNKGSINLTITGGTAPFTYNWSNGATTKDITGLTSGTYTVVVKDATNCVETFGLTITEPSTGTALTLATITTPSNCGASTGAVDLTPTGGLMPYTYAWSNSATTQDIINIAAGTYTVSVTDAQGCVQTSVNLVNDNAAPTITSTVNNVSCKSGTTGSITLTVSGGASPYTYNWSNSTSAASLTGVGVGKYTVTVTAANNCKVIATNTIAEPAEALSLVTNKNAPNCTGTGGEAFATPSGGTAPYTYAWSNSATTASISNLSPATYNVTVTDARSCPVNGSVVITAAACLPPVAVNDNFTTPLNTPITQTVAPNDSDPDGLAADLIYTLLTRPTVSQGVINFDNTYGNFTFTPTTGFTGTVTLTYQVCDLTNLCTTATLTINVIANVIPVTESGTSPSTGGTPIANVRSNDTVNGAAATSSNSTISQIGVWQSGITLNTTTGAITVANGTAPGVYSVTYQLCDLATPTPNCATVADSITVTPDCNATSTGPLLIKN